MSQPLKVLHVFARMNRGGAECRTLDLMRAVDRCEIQMDFCALSGLPGDLDCEIRLLGGEVYRLALRQAGFSRAFRSLLTEKGYDVVHSHVHYPSGWILRLAHQAGVPRRVVHFRNESDGRRDTWFRRLVRWVLRRLITRHATQIVAVSESAMRQAWMPRWDADPRCHVIYNGLDLARFPDPADVGRCWTTREKLGILPESLLCIHVGSLRPAKNHARLLRIFKALQERTPGAMLMLAGDTLNQGAWLATQISAIGLCPSVRVLGPRKDVPDLLAAADVMIFPSLWEGLPGAILESLAVGTPVVSSDLTCLPEITRFVPGVRAIALAEPDHVWAETIASIAHPSTEARAEVRRAFAASPFNIHYHAQQMRELWRGGKQSHQTVLRDRQSDTRPAGSALVRTRDRRRSALEKVPREGRSAA